MVDCNREKRGKYFQNDKEELLVWADGGICPKGENWGSPSSCDRYGIGQCVVEPKKYFDIK